MLSFSKFHGAGNDFILLDDWSCSFDPSDASRIAALCDRRTGIGADGLILLRPPRPSCPGAHVRMVFRNSDGSPAAMCGNGGRCLARFAFETGHAPADMLLDTDAGPLAASVLPDSTVRLQLPPPSDERLNLSATVNGEQYTLHAINTGVPHALYFLPPTSTPADIAAFPLVPFGRAVRHHPLFAPAGTNVDVALVLPSASTIRLRTYERGVEDETLACGTGAVAAATLARRLHLIDSPSITILPASSTPLLVSFPPSSPSPHLTGPAVLSFSGTTPL